MKKIAFLSIAPHAGSEIGHPFMYQCLCDKAVTAIGDEFTAYLPKNCGVERVPGHWKKMLHPLFNRKGRRGYFKDMIHLFRDEKRGEKRVFFVEYHIRRDLRLFAIAALLFGKRNDSIFLLYRDDLTTRRKKDAIVTFFFSRLLRLRFGKRFLAGVDNELLADYYERKLSMPLEILPIMDATVRPIQVQSKECLITTWPGQPRNEKGMKEIAGLFAISDPKASCVELDLSGATMVPRPKNGLKLHLRRACLEEEEYKESLFRSDVVLLPYDADRYKWRTSGILVEAVMAGKMPVVKEGSWLASELKRFGLEKLIVDWTDPLFFSNLFKLWHDVSIWEKLKIMQADYSKTHCLENFTLKMKEILAKVR